MNAIRAALDRQSKKFSEVQMEAMVAGAVGDEEAYREHMDELKRMQAVNGCLLKSLVDDQFRRKAVDDVLQV